jgi:LPXTG-site transpeptidase (sortase) family protein
MPERRRARPKRRVSPLRLAALVSALAAAGIVLWLYGADIAYVFGLVGKTNPYGSTFAEASVPASTSAGASASALASGPVTQGKRQVATAPKGIPKGPRLVVPRVGIDVAVSGGDQTRALARGTYHHAGTPDAGQGGNVVLAGHRISAVFSLLYRVRAGDPVILYWNGKELDYRVSQVFDVGAADTSILRSTAGEQLTLYTCLPRELGDKHTVVVALPVAP